MSTDFASLAPAAAKQAADKLDPKLKQSAMAKGWHHEIDVVAKDGKVMISYQEEQEGDIFDVEYGNKDVSPNSVIRPFISGSQAALADSIAEAAINHLFDTGILP